MKMAYIQACKSGAARKHIAHILNIRGIEIAAQVQTGQLEAVFKHLAHIRDVKGIKIA